MIRVIFCFILVLYKFVFQIDWLGNRRNGYAAEGGDQAFLIVFFYVYEPLTGVLIFSIVLYKCLG